MLRRLAQIGATVAVFDRSTLEPGYALRCAIGVAIPLCAGLLAHQPAYGVAAAVGAFITGFSSQQGVHRTRLAAVAATALGMAVTGLLGSLAAHTTIAIVALAVVVGYAYGVVTQLGQVATTAGLNAFVGFIVFSSEPLAPGAATVQAAFVLAGGALQIVLLLASWPMTRLGAERLALADAYAQLAGYARAVGRGESGFPPIAPLATARQVLSDPQPFSSAANIARLTRMLEDAEALRRHFAAIAIELLERGCEREALGALCTTAGDGLEAIAAVLRGARCDAPALAPPLEIRGEVAASIAADVLSLCTDALQAAVVLSHVRLVRVQFESAPRPGLYFRPHVDWLQPEAWRFAIVIGVAMLCGRAFSIGHGYWIPLTAGLVLKPELQATLVRGAARVAGTIVGAVIAAAFLAVAAGSEALQAAGVVVAAGVSYLTFFPNYAIFTVAVTSFVVIVLGLRGLPETLTIEQRVLGTLAGGALAAVAYAVAPTWERRRTRELLAETIAKQSAFANALLTLYAAQSPQARTAIAPARAAAWKARTALEASIDRARREPYRTHSIAVGRAVRMLATMQRFALSSLALESLLAQNPPARPFPEISAPTAALRETMNALADAVRDDRRMHFEPSIVAELDRMAPAGDEPASAQRRVLIDRLRGYAQAAERLSRLAGRADQA